MFDKVATDREAAGVDIEREGRERIGTGIDERADAIVGEARVGVGGVDERFFFQVLWVDGAEEPLTVALGDSSISLVVIGLSWLCLLYTSPSPRDKRQSRMPSSA